MRDLKAKEREGDRKREQNKEREKGSREGAAGSRRGMRRIPITSCSFSENKNNTLCTESVLVCVCVRACTLHAIREMYSVCVYGTFCMYLCVGEC